MLNLVIGLVVGVLVGWHTTKPAVVDTVVAKVKGLFGK